MATAGEPMDKGDEVEEDSDAPLSLTPEQQPASRGEQDEEVKLYHSSQLIQVSLEEYKHQASIGTQQAVRQLKMSPEFKMHVQKCHRSYHYQFYFPVYTKCALDLAYSRNLYLLCVCMCT